MTAKTEYTLRPRDIIGNKEVRRMCGPRGGPAITRHTLIRWRADLGFPEPIRALSGRGHTKTELWDARQVRAWLRERRDTQT